MVKRRKKPPVHALDGFEFSALRERALSVRRTPGSFSAARYAPAVCLQAQQWEMVKRRKKPPVHALDGFEFSALRERVLSVRRTQDFFPAARYAPAVCLQAQLGYSTEMMK